MSQSSTLTRCPHCETRFRVTEEQLGIARGKVRCGNCMQVFNALEHSESETPAGKRPASADKPAPASDTGANRFQTDEEFIFEDDPEEDAAEGNYAGTKTSFSEDELSDSFLNFDERKAGSFDDSEDDLPSDVDESWAEAMLDEDERLARKRKTAAEEPERPAAAPKPDPATRPAAAPAPENTPPSPTRPTEEAPQFELTDEDTPDDTLRATPPPSEHDEPLAATQRMGHTTPYDNLRYDPISVDGGGRSWVRKTLWTLIVVALLAALVSQVTYFQLDRLSSIPELRPYYEQGCDIIGCELPPLVAIDRIQSQKLVVRTDPQTRDTLIVDAVITNQAGFEQPFPNIGLTFSNLNGDVVAQSVFEPDEYLAGEAQQMERMPSQRPIRISISIRDPGRDAVNYNLTFVARSKSAE